jgi:hypothetical protein
MNHKSHHSGNTTISTGNTDTLIGLVIKFPYKKEGCANAEEASCGHISLQVPYSHIGRALGPAACVQARICRALAPTLYRHEDAHIGCALTPPLKTPHLGYIGVHPPLAKGSSIMSDGGEEPAVAAAEEYIMGGAGNLLIDVDEDEDAELPVLNSIWECQKINKCSGFDDNGKPFAGWTCGWCPLYNDGSQPKPFRPMNATKALLHVSKVAGFDIRPCRGNIPAAKSKQYKALYLSKTLTKEQRKSRKDTMSNSISDLQDRTVLALAEGATKSSRHAL